MQIAQNSFFQQVRSDVLRWRPVYSHYAFLRLLILQHGFQLAFSIRVQRQVKRVPFVGRPLSLVLWYVTCVLTASDVSTDACIGEGVYFPHTTGTVIGRDSIVGAQVTIYQGVTLGRLRHDGEGVLYPTIGDGACLYTGAKIVGPIRVGKGAVVGANAVVLKDVPDGHAAVGVPARIIPPNAEL